MSKPIRVNAFAIHAPVHLSPGLWTHPRDRSVEFSSLKYWTDVVKILERGRFDALFIADSLALHDVYAGNGDAALRSGVQVPKHDPFTLISALAASTEHLGFGVTASTSHELPFPLARRYSSLDHLSNGRIAWNIVTGYSTAGAKAIGKTQVVAHDTRYDIADEFLDATYHLWEGSWEDGALRADKVAKIFADPSKIHKVRHKGQYFELDAIHLVDPSPQRTPFLFQAGTSPRGREFAAAHAEAVFLSDPSKSKIAEHVADVRRRAVAHGRLPTDVLFFALITVIVGSTEAEARAKLADYQTYVDTQGALALFSGWTGIDLSQYDLDDPFPVLHKDNAIRSTVDSFVGADKVWTIREVINHNTIGGRGPIVVGDPQQVADQLQAWVAETDIDGFNLSYAVTPEGYSDFADLVVPELQRRGVYKTEYAPGTLREKVFGRAATLPDSHPAAKFRPRSRV